MTSDQAKPEVNFLGRVFIGPYGLRSGWRIVIFLIILIILEASLRWLALAVPAVRARLVFMASGKFDPYSLLIFELINVVSAFIAVAAMARIEGRSFDYYGLPTASALGRRFWQGTAWGLVTVSVLYVVVWAEHLFSFGTLALRGVAIFKFAVVWALGTFLVGIFEELVFRGYIQLTLAKGIRFWPAALVSSALFGASHLANPGDSWVIALSAGVFGFFFCLTLRRTGALWFAVGMHAAVDYGETFLFSPSGGGSQSAVDHLLNATLRGPTWLTGGHIGPEASVNGIVVFAVLFIFFQALYPKTAEREW